MFVLDSTLCKTIRSISSFNCVTCFSGESISIVRLKLEKINKVHNMVKCEWIVNFQFDTHRYSHALSILMKKTETNITENKEKGYHQHIIITTKNS